ncbi:hypothetical protein Dtox_0013 [Desulfofarcimen acetoxidans DSM 771]|uniref:PARP catalytic domain-containing protein n=1 Tax=Desulfofarcimen acetoxidans (strain ATCC 49208 / DSM 771 / KCTC 5769 / VKM B-1644 / 5575) TaxID=485916 RepID=C8VVA8_DESAS|nr:hypothetical protein [Desulfofarcimen acetoxidans]ACV60977.1 hypothetical protein Dtox_0013 [Desulfofarcimen acetoxidans DSM 771]
MAETFIGFHGTTAENAKEIIKTRYFKYSMDDEEWLGEGVYFFEKDIKQAYYYCVKAKKYTNWTILKSKIVCNVFWDLTLTDHVEEFQKIAKLFKDRYHKRKDGRPRKLMNAVVFNAMYKLKPFDIIRAPFPVPKGYVVQRTNIVPIHIQLCVRNSECICKDSIEEVSYNGH